MRLDYQILLKSPPLKLLAGSAPVVLYGRCVSVFFKSVRGIRLQCGQMPILVKILKITTLHTRRLILQSKPHVINKT